MVAVKLSKKDEQLKEVNAQLEQYKVKVQALSAELKESRKRRRSDARDAAKTTASAEREELADSGATPPLTKKPSPEPKPPAKAAGTPTIGRKKATVKPSSSEDEPPSPVKTPSPPPRIPTSYAGLNSVVCAFKEGGFTPGKDGMTFELCAELVHDEVQDIKGWTKSQRAEHHEMIFSALELVYPGKTKKWRQLPFAKSNSATVNYWVKVLNKWRHVWLKKAAQSKKPASPRSASPAMEALTKRIRDKLASKTADKVKQVAEKAPVAKKAPSSSAKRPIVISGSDSDEEPAAEAAAEDDTATKRPPSKLADPPESYSRAEMKAFAKAARAINNVSSDKGHVAATADLIDAEFSDQSGRAARILRSPFSWKRQKFKEIAAKAARIMEERSRTHVQHPHPHTEHIAWA